MSSGVTLRSPMGKPSERSAAIRAATARAGELELSIEANAVKADEAASELARATAQYEEAAAELDAAKKKVSDLDAVYRDLGVRRGSLERELSALSKDNGALRHLRSDGLHADRCQGILRLEIGNAKRKCAGSFVFDANVLTGIGKRESLDHA